MMTVVIINDFGYANGGASQVAIENALLMKKMGYRVIFFTAVLPIEEKLTAAGIEIIYTNQKEFLNYTNKIKGAFFGIWNKTAANKLRFLLEQLDNETTVVHVHVWIKALSCSIFSVLKKCRFKFVITAHDYFLTCPNGGFYNYRKCSLCKLHALSIGCILCNCDKRNYFQKLYRVVRQQVQNSTLKKSNPNIIYVSKFSREIIKTNLKMDFNSALIRNPINPIPKILSSNHETNFYLYIGRLSPEKGPDIFCEAISRLKLLGVVIGEGEMQKELVKKYPNIHFTGWLSHDEIAKYLLKARALVITSRCYETAVLTIPEVQVNYDIPVIVGDQCAGREYIIDGKNGYLFKSDSFDSLLDVIRRTEGSTSYKFIKRHYNVNNGFELDDLYKKLLRS